MIKIDLKEFEHTVEIIKNRLFFCVTSQNYKYSNNKNVYYFSIDEELCYQNFASDFGPLNISCLFKYCSKLNRILANFKGYRKIVHYTSTDAEKKVNSAFLIGSFCILYLQQNPFEVYEKLVAFEPFKQFVDALKNTSMDHTIKLLDCLKAVGKGAHFNFFNFSDFNVAEYDLFENPKFGNLNWIVPRKFIGFAGPTAEGQTPYFYLQYFLQNDVKTVVRLNNKLYDSNVFTHNGIEHYDLFFNDGGVPSKEMLQKFLEIAKSAPAAVAIHCKAGLGRTGTLISAYLIMHYAMDAKEAIAWLRICRPGSVIGAQQGWLEDIEPRLKEWGNEYRLKHYGAVDRIPRHKFGIYSVQWPMIRRRIMNHNKRKVLRQVLDKGKCKYNY